MLFDAFIRTSNWMKDLSDFFHSFQSVTLSPVYKAPDLEISILALVLPISEPYDSIFFTTSIPLVTFPKTTIFIYMKLEHVIIVSLDWDTKNNI